MMTLFGVQTSQAQWATCPSEQTLAVDDEKTITVEFEEGYTETSVLWTYLGSTSVINRIDNGTNESTSVTIKGVKEGTTSLVCKASAKKDSKLYSQVFTCKVTVKAPEPPAPIALEKITAPEGGVVEVAKGTSVDLTTKFTFTPADASKENLVWKSENRSIAVVTSAGIVRGVKEGETTISVQDKTSNEIPVTCTVKVVGPDPISVTLPEKAEVKVGDAPLELQLTTIPSDASTINLKWTSDNEEVATVNNGKVTAVSDGTATITVKLEGSEEVTASCEVTVVSNVDIIVEDATSFELPETKEVVMGETVKLEPTNVQPEGASTENVTWESDKPEFATVSEEGVVKGVKAGTATITATTADGQTTVTCTVTVLPPAPTFISLPASIYLAKGKKQTLELTKIQPEDASTTYIVWTSADETIATVSETGEVEGKAIGTVKITATVKDTKISDECEVNVVAPDPTKIEFVEGSQSIELAIGGTQELKPTLTPADASKDNLVWESDNKEVAIVNQYGKVTAIKAGEANIKVYLKAPEVTVYATCKVTVKPADPVAITLSETSIELAINEEKTLVATVFPSDASTANLEWKPSNSDVATVSNAGVVKGLKAGKTTVKYCLKGSEDKVFATCEVTVKASTPTAISLPETKEVTVGQKVTLTPTFEGPTTTNIEWSSSDTNIATVSAEGEVTGVKAGSALITVKVKDSGLSASCLVTVNAKVPTTITLPTEVQKVQQGEELQLTYTVDPSDAALTWESDKKEVAVVSQSGVVTGIKAGTAKITVKFGDTELGSCQVEVLAPAPKAIVLIETGEVKVGEELTLTPTVTPSNASATELVWESSDEAVATVTDGVVKGVKAGTANIKVTIKGTTISATCKVTVVASDPAAPTGIKLSAEDDATTVKRGSTLKLTPTFEPEGTSADNLTWSSENPAIATVSKTGIVTGVKAGTATIKVQINETTISATYNVTVVSPDPTAVSLPATAEVAKDEKLTLTPTLWPADASTTGFVWTSSNEAVATVSEAGEVTGVAEGTATITVKIANGNTASCQVTVTAPELTNIKLPETEEVIAGNSLTLSPVLTPTEASNANLTWSSSDKAVAVVNSKGVVTGLKEGRATIKVMFSETVFAECMVIVLPASAAAPTAIALPETEEVMVGSTLVLTPEMTPLSASTEGLTWISSDEAVATVSKGVVKGVKAGTATITVKYSETVFAKCEVTVVAPELSSIALPKTAEVIVKETLTLTPVIWPAEASLADIAWTSSDEKVATVSEDGVVTGVAVGTAKITVKANGLTASCEVKVLAPEPTAISLPASIELALGSTYELTPVLTPADASTEYLTWTSTYETVATVSQTGVVTAVKVGKAVIVATMPNGEYATCKVTVTANTDIAGMDNALYIIPTNVQEDANEFKLWIRLKNKATVAGASFTLTMPKGLSLAKDAAGDLVYRLNSERAKSEKFSVYGAFNTDGSCSVRIMPTGKATISGKDGLLLTLTVNVADGVAGDQVVRLTSNSLTVKNSDGTLSTLELADTNTAISVLGEQQIAGQTGDVNGDGVVDLTDAVMILYASLGVEQKNYDASVADVNGDGVVDVTDAIAIVNSSLNDDQQQSSSRRKAASDNNSGLVIDDVVISKGGMVELPVKFENSAAGKIVGVQMKLVLPEGITTMKDEELPVAELDGISCQKMTLFSTANDGFGMLPMSQNASVSGSEGTLFTTTLLANNELEAGSILEAKATNVRFTVKDENGIHSLPVNDFTFVISIDVDDPDAIVEMAAEAQENADARYSLSGQRVGNNFKGIVVTNGRKVMIK